MNSQKIIRVALVLLTVGLLLSVFLINAGSKCSGENIKIKNYTLCADLVDSSSERLKGLSGREYLDKNEAMLFVFDSSDKHGIWMKDMLISLDILWLNINKEITHIEKRVSPDTYPEAFFPPVPSKYVIEVAAGLSDELGINIGDKLEW